jgi:hypothetical protein
MYKKITATCYINIYKNICKNATVYLLNNTLQAPLCKQMDMQQLPQHIYCFYSCWPNHQNSFHINHFQYLTDQSFYFKAPLKISHNTTQMLAPGTGYDPSGLSVASVPVLALHLTT